MAFLQPLQAPLSPNAPSTYSAQTCSNKNNSFYNTTRVTLTTGSGQGRRRRRAVKRSTGRSSTSRATTTPTPIPTSPTNYSDWSSDFLELCNEQLALLMSTIPNIDFLALFFRHENEAEGALEFVPLIVHSSNPDDKPTRVWISSGPASETELEKVLTSRALPGSFPANWILPDYPFTSVSHHGGIYMPDGGLCVPVEYNDVIAGSIVVRPKVILPNPEDQWQPADIQRVDMVAKSISLAAALEGKWHAYKGLLGTTRTLLESVRSLLRTTLHQIRSPLQALVTFGNLMMRKLPVKDSNRDLAKHVIVEALRVDELLKPLDEVREKLILPEGLPRPLDMTRKVASLKKEFDSDQFLFDDDDFLEDDIDSPETRLTKDGLELMWLSEALQPAVERAQVLASNKGLKFIADLDEECAPIMAVEKFVREAISNLIDNALQYTPKGSYVGMTTSIPKDDGISVPEESANVIVWDTGYGFSVDEIEQIWEYGFRGSAAKKSGTNGSGLGLGITEQLLRSCSADIELCTPLPKSLDPRAVDDATKSDQPGSAFIMSFRRPTRKTTTNAEKRALEYYESPSDEP